ncbi:sugar transferase [Blastococcus sp. SYSU D00813]
MTTSRIDGGDTDAGEDGVPGEDDPEVRPLDRLRPVPPPRRAGPLTGRPAASLLPEPPGPPRYDPYSARRRPTPTWLVTHTTGLVVTDVLAAVVAVVLAQHAGLRGASPSWLPGGLVVLLWPVLLLALGAYAERRQGAGGDEYRRVAVGGLLLTTALALAAPSAHLAEWHRLQLAAVPAVTVLTLLGRVVHRRRLTRARRRGTRGKRVLVVGRDAAVLDVVQRLERDPAAGLQVVGACVPDPASSATLVGMGVPVLGGLDGVVPVVDDVRADAVLVASASETAARYTRELAWQLEGTHVELLVCSGMVEVAPHRLLVRPTATLPLLSVREPEFRGARRVAKDAFDRLVAGLLILAVAPVLVGLAALIRATSPGPAFYRHRRIGKNGREFDVLKFRSMVVDAEARMGDLMVFNEGNAVQFKLRADPRVTPVGRFLRKYSLDELPQLFNVLKGEMSLVGPRPHVTREVEQYGPAMHRRLLVKPGITGLWQVSGRSDLSWEESVALDVRYVENWSPALDAAILLRTAGAVLRSSGAY